MDFFAWIFGILGGLSALVGVGNAFTLIPAFYKLDWMFWFALSIILLLASIAFAIANRKNT